MGPFYIIIFLIAVMIGLSKQGHIYSWNIQITYDFLGRVESFLVPFKLESGLALDEYFEIEWPFSLGTTSQTYLHLYIEENNIEITPQKIMPESTSDVANNRYIFKISGK